MSGQLIGTIRLIEEDSINFFNSLFRPTDEEIRRHDELIKKIDNDITIIENHDGFIAEIDELDCLLFDDVCDAIIQIMDDISRL